MADAMKVYCLELYEHGGYCIFINPEDLREDLQEENKHVGKDNIIDVDTTLEKIKNFKPGEVWECDWASAACLEMTEEEFESLPEFEGW